MIERRTLKVIHHYNGSILRAESSVERELIYLLEHCVHHQAMIKLAVNSLSYITLDKNFGVDAEGFILMTLTREEIANILGTAKETCIRALTSFKKQGWISTDGKRIKIKDHKALLKLAENR